MFPKGNTTLLGSAIEAAVSAAVAAIPAASEAPAAVRSRGRASDLPHVMARIFDTPLLIDSAKLDVILAALGPRLDLLVTPPRAVKTAGADVQLNNVSITDVSPQPLLGAWDDDDDDAESDPYEMTSDGIALISVDGSLVYKSSWLGALSGLTSYSSIADAVTQAATDPSVKGILLQINSYGGEANGCFDATDAIFAARSSVPIYGVAADNAYSGGYALLSAASKVFVSRTSGVGSIGVACAHVDRSAQDKMWGLKYTYIYSGDRKIDGNPHEALSPEARADMQAESDRLRGIFAASVAKYRGLSVDAVVATQAAKFFGETAVAAKLADAMGTPADALAALRAEIASKASGGMPAVARPATAVAAAGEPATVEVQPSAPQVVKETAYVVDLDAERQKVRGESTAHNLEIIELCALADEPALAAEFIRTGKSIAQVRDALQMRRVEASNARNISGHISPDAGDLNPKAAADGWEKAIVSVRGRLKEK